MLHSNVTISSLYSQGFLTSFLTVDSYIHVLKYISILPLLSRKHEFLISLLTPFIGILLLLLL